MQLAQLKSTSRFLFVAAVLALSIPASAQTVLMSARPLFDGLQPGVGVVPMEVDLANTGPDARGVVRVSAGNYTMSYPVELPQGTKKRLITYPDCGTYAEGGLQFDLITNRGHIHQTDPATGFGQGQLVVGEISEDEGDLGFLKTSGRYGPATTVDVYAKPVDAPDRSAGYDRITALVLGDGAERLSDDSVSAIKTWMLGGGTVIFIGGASAPVLNDSRWADVLPVRNAVQKNLAGSTSLEARYGSSPKEFTAMVGQPVSNATSRAGGLILERPFGLGRSVYLAFNPFENPMLSWTSRPKMFTELLAPSVTGPQMVTSSVINIQQGGTYYGRGYYGGTYPAPDASENNPFQATLPQTSKVLWILGCYFLAVVPLNFLVLRRLKKGELAWGTAPILSLAFAGVFFASAQGLYSAQLSTSTKGILIEQQGEPNALVLGYSQMYFPHGGRYDLRLSGVDSLIQNSAYEGYGYNQHSVYDDLEPVDTGELQASIDVPNLAFRELTYREHEQVNDWFDLHPLRNGTISVTNRSPYLLANARIVGGGASEVIGDLKPGQTREIAFNNSKATADDFSVRLAQFLTRSGAYALTGRLTGFRTGPRIGTEVKASPGLDLAFVSNDLVPNSVALQTSQGFVSVN